MLEGFSTGGRVMRLLGGDGERDGSGLEIMGEGE